MNKVELDLYILQKARGNALNEAFTKRFWEEHLGKSWFSFRMELGKRTEAKWKHYNLERPDGYLRRQNNS